jgi:hypothetical protein
MIYFVRCSETNAVKIGYAVDPWKRFSKIQSDSPGLWRRGEWFDYGPDLQSHVASLPPALKPNSKRALGGTLGAWLRENDLTLREFARISGCTISSLSCICAGTRIPRKEAMRRIFAVTRGAVQPNDFYDLPDLPAEREQAA